MRWQIARLTIVIVTAVTFVLVSPTAIGRAGESDMPTALAKDHLQAACSKTANQPCSGPIRISFSPGTTSAVVEGHLAANHSVQYMLRAFAGQLMEVDLSAPEGARLSVTTVWGWPLVPITGGPSGFMGYLPASGDYIVTVTSSSQPISYSLNISIPQRISFERGTTSATLEGHLGAYQGHDYILRAQAGQLMEISVSPDKPDSSLKLIIYGVDGTVLMSGMGDGSFFRGELPFSEDYIVTVRAGERPVAFNLSVVIPRRISFQPGAISGSEAGYLSAYHSQHYVLRAMQNQTMQVQITPGNVVQLIIYGADGTVLSSGIGEGASFIGVLPSTQDYILVVKSGGNPVWYRLQVTIW